MNFDKLFEIIDNLVGDEATFKGLTFEFEHGIFVIDYFNTGYKNETLFICDFIPRHEEEPVSFAAKGIKELKEQLSEFVLQ